jgi:hypothetical protein
MRVTTIQDISNVDNLPDLVKFSSQMINQIMTVLSGRVGFLDNCATQLITVPFTVANTEVLSNHTLGFVPNGYLIAGKSVSMDVYDGVSLNTTNKIYLRSSAIGTAKVLVF